LKRRIESGSLGGVILFKRNVESADQVASLLEDIRDTAPQGLKPLTAVDQEGGRVVRIGEPRASLPAARMFGEIDDSELTEAAGSLVGRELKALGFSLNFAPILDIDTNPNSPVIGDRSFGSTAGAVIRHGLAFGRGLLQGGVIPCAKHFPGHGDTKLDSHLSLPKVDCDRERLESVEMKPFEEWARAGLGPIMAAHVIYESLDPKNPATTSRLIVGDELRGRLGFLGVVFSDDLEMGAISKMGGPAEASVKAMVAGIDGLLVCRSQEAQASVIEALAIKAAEDDTFEGRLRSASDRLAALDNPNARNVDFKWIGSTEHLTLKRSIKTRLAMEAK
jgi:beta-N-acetylhexosaminidase